MRLIAFRTKEGPHVGAVKGEGAAKAQLVTVDVLDLSLKNLALH